MADSIRAILSKNLLALRTERGLSQVELAQRAGFQYASYNRWENGKSWPEPETIAALAGALGVSEGRLFQEISSTISPREALTVLSDLVNSLNL